MTTAQPILIGICGAIGSGKTSVADYLEARHSFTAVGFADALKDICINMFNLSALTCYGTQLEKNSPIEHLGVVPEVFAAFGDPWPQRVGGPWTGRWLLEFIGTDVGRVILPNIWVDMAIRHVMTQRETTGQCYLRHVVPDVRFQNEADAIYEAGGQLWKVVCTDREAEQTGHQSDGAELTFPGAHFYTLQAPHGHLPTLFNRADTLVFCQYRAPQFARRSD